MVMALIAMVVATVRQERTCRSGAPRNPARWNYLGGSVALIAGLVVDPAAGLMSYVFAHAAEYVIIVNRTLRSRYASRSLQNKPLLSAVARTTARRWLLLAVFFSGFGVVDLMLGNLVSASSYVIVAYTIGLLHFVYDGCIWKTRKPAVAADFGIPPLSLGALG
jgi:hypothetical protein